MGLKTGLILMLALKTATADVIISTFGSGDSFISLGGDQVGGGGAVGNNDELAVAFTPTSDDVFTQIRIAAFSTSSTRGDLDLVVDFSKGAVPGAPIETFETTVLDGDARIYTFNSVLHPALLAGQTYWIVLTSDDLVDNFFGWNFSNTWNYTSMAERRPGSSVWQLFCDSSPAFEVSGQSAVAGSVPEPRMMLGVGLAILLLGLQRRRLNRRVTATCRSRK